MIRSGITGWNGENRQNIEYTLTLQSNPQFTSSVLISVARAALRMRARGQVGCYTMFDIAPADLSIHTREELIRTML